jgi:ABC-type lipoprotein release transport system permease subunit
MVILLLAAAATLATVIPARRACRVDPAVTLRED